VCSAGGAFGAALTLEENAKHAAISKRIFNVRSLLPAGELVHLHASKSRRNIMDAANHNTFSDCTSRPLRDA
jgi:hypothetical protein